jgi:GNAT superfamily N-acetyltransferase
LRFVEYDPSWRRPLAELRTRINAPETERELEWFYEQNPVRPAAALLAVDRDRVVATVAMAFLRMAIGERVLEVGMPLRVATDPDYRGRGIFTRLQAENEERAQDAGVELLLTVPNRESAPVFLKRLGWRSLHPVRLWARPRLFGRGRRPPQVDRFTHDAPSPPSAAGDRVLRDLAWLNWRFADSPRPYVLVEHDGHIALGRRGPAGLAAIVESGRLSDAAAVATGRILAAAPPPWEARRYLAAGFVPTHRKLTVLGKSLTAGQPVPEQPHFELGDLDFV